MSWADLLGQSDSVIAPWLGGRSITSGVRSWTIDGPLPPEHGWYSFTTRNNRKATVLEPALADPELFSKSERVSGYLIGNRLIADDSPFEPDSGRIIGHSRVVYLLEPGLERFSRALAAVHDGRLVYLQLEFPMGPESEVTHAYEDRAQTLDDIAEVTPALHMAFRWHSWWRAHEERRARELEAERLREEAARQREAERRQAEERARVAERQSAKRRERQERRARRAIARLPHRQRSAAQAQHEARRVLATAGAELLDWTPSHNRDQVVVRFRFLGHRFRSVVRVPGLRVVEAGICLTDAHSGERGDERFTLASLPAVIRQAQRQGELVILRW